MTETVTLLETLRSDGRARERRRAACMLRDDRSAEAVSGLLAAVNDADADVAQAAIMALLHQGSTELRDQITKPRFLLSGNATVRWTAAHAMRHIGDRSHLVYLVKLAQDADWSVRCEAVSTLERLLDRLGEEMKTADELTAHEDVKLLIRMLQLKHPAIRERIVELLLSPSLDISMRHLLDGLNSDSLEIKTGVIRALGVVGKPGIMRHLAPLTAAPAVAVRLEAVKAVARIGGAEAWNLLVSRLGDGDQAVIAAAMDALVDAAREDAAAGQVVRDRLAESRSVAVRKNILHVMGRIGGETMVPVLFANLGDSHHFIRSAAARSLVRYGGAIREQVADAMTVLDVPVDGLMKVAGDSAHLRLRLQVIAVLGALRNPQASVLLEGLATDPCREVAEAAERALEATYRAAWERASCAYVLGEVGDGSSVAVLCRALSDWSVDVRFAAISALRKLRLPASTGAIAAAAAGETDREIRGEMLAALGDIGVFNDGIKELLRSGLADESHLVRRQAARAAGYISGDPEFVDLLIEQLADPSLAVRTSCLNALYTLGEPVRERVREAFTTSDTMLVRFHCLSLLGIFEDHEMGPAIEALAADAAEPMLRRRAALVLQVLRSGRKDERERLFAEK